MGNAYGIDIGTSNFKMCCSDKDKILNEKNIIAIANKTEILAFGDEAYEMYEKAPEHIEVSFPVKFGVIADIENMQTLLFNFFNKINEGKKITGSDFYIAVPTDVTEVEKRAFYELVVDSKVKAKNVYVVDKPVDQADEIEYMTKGNFHRNDPKEIQNEYRIAANNWDTMSSKRRKEIQDTLLKSFEERNKTNPAYIENKEEFLKNRFRPKYEYIRSITGLEVSNSTIKNQIKEETIETETVDEKEETNKSKVVTGKKVVKAATTLLGLLDLYEPYEEELGVIEDAINALNDLVDGMMTE